MNTLELLLAKDLGKVDLPVKEVEIPRLTQICGEKVIFKVKGLTNEQYSFIRENATSPDGTVNPELMQAYGVIEGLEDPCLKSPQLREKYNCATNVELLNKLLNVAEIMELFNIVAELTGFGSDCVKQVEEIKN